ncbi:hypothetical protein TSUD_403640 [Trifolium subterraneum]|uniref:Uncharacterized protein n=1 Tax=Trifolium subterraneum TaxID=3900 RepID=A0A2Z6NT94_TRISU|nr:hypothetical protein TSUD_403640 [Trifolium subterraneum]
MAGANNEFVGENNHPNPPNHQNQFDGVETSVTPEGSVAHAQATPLDVPPPHQPPQPEDPLVVPQVPQGAPMEVVMAALVNTINRQGQIIREQVDNMRGQNELIREQNRRLRAVEESRAASRISRSTRRQRSSTPENNRSRSRSRSSRPAPRRNGERPLSPPRDIPRRQNHSPPQRNNHISPPRNRRSPPRRNNRSSPRNGEAGEAAACGGNGRHSQEGNLRAVGTRGTDDPSQEESWTFHSHEDWKNLQRWTNMMGQLTLTSMSRALRPPSTTGICGDKMKLYLLEEGLLEGTKFQEAVGILEVQTLDAFFELAQRYIKYKDKQNASEVRRPKTFEVGGPSSQREERRGDEKKREGGKVREAKPSKSQFTYHTPLNAPRDRILSEISSAEFKSAGIRTANNNAPRQNQLAVDPANPEQHVEEENRVIGGVALAISRPEDFLPLQTDEENGALDYLAAHLDGSWENFPGALVISGGGFNPITIGSIKRKFDELEKASPLTEENLVPYVGSDLQGFNGSTTKPWGYVYLIVTFGENKAMKSVKVKFLVVDCPSLYNCIIGRPTLAELFAVSSTIHLKLKYYTKDGQVATINGDIEAARRCFEVASKNLNSVVTPKKKKTETKLPGVNSISTEDGVELDARTSKKERKQLKACLRENAELFAWSAAEMPGIDPEVACHQLTIDPRATAVVQRRRKQSPEKAEAARKAKSNGKWRMCVDYTDLNRACPKDAYPLPNIDKLVDNSSGFKLLSFMDAYSGYNQIKMAEIDKKKTAFMTETGNYYYNVMPFGLKNAGATYQSIMNKVFHNEIGDMLEVYMDDMIVKSEEEIDHTVHLKRVFDQARKFNMRFNPEKCTFGVKAGKFLGFYLTERRIEANPDKCRAFFDYPTPKSKKSIQTLNGMLTSMARFTEECEGALQYHKRALSEPPVLTRPTEGEKLYLYLIVASEAIIAVLIRETEQGQKPVYFVSRALQGLELRYLQIEKIALAVIMAARNLRYYFLAHSIVIRTDQPVKQLLARPDMVGRMLKWSLELAEFDISFESRKTLKAQVLADFLAEMTTSTTSEKNKWTIFVDGSSNSQGSGAGIILENGDGVLIEVPLGLSFPTTNNQAEYKAFLAGLRLAEDMGAEEIKIFTDSQLVASQVSGEYQTKEERLLEYLNLIKSKLTKFKETEVKHVPREHNARADVLSKLASTRRKKAGNQSLIQEILTKPSIEKTEILTKPSIEKTVEVMHICAIDEQSWMAPVYNFLKSNTLPADAKEATKIRKRACSYVLLDDKLYRRRFSIPLLKCVEETRVEFILQEIHEGINGHHIGGRSLARKALRAGYYWPTMQNDAKDHVLKCDKCQRHGDMHIAPANELKTLISPWPFAWWGMDILEPLAKISASHILRFFKINVLARFGIPQVVVTDNGTQFTNKKFQEFLATIGTTQHFTSVEHPQTNGQAEAANRVILRGLRRRMGASKGNWTEELHNVLWSYITTPHSTTGETPFRLTYGTEAVIPVEIGEPSSRFEYPHEEDINDELLREELDLVEELRTGASLREATLKQKIAARHDKRVIKREFEVGSLVLRRNQKDSREGKLAANWEGPYRVRAKTENGVYHLEDLYGKEIPRTWNAEKIKQYYS